MKQINTYITEKLHLKKGINRTSKVIESINKIGWVQLDEKEYIDLGVNKMRIRVPAAMYDCTIDDVISFFGEPSFINKLKFGNADFVTYNWAFMKNNCICRISTETNVSYIHQKTLFEFTTKSKSDFDNISELVDKFKEEAKNTPYMKKASIGNNINKKI